MDVKSLQEAILKACDNIVYRNTEEMAGYF